MKRIFFFSFPVILKVVCGIVAVAFAVMAVMAITNPRHAAYYALMAVGMVAGCWLIPTMERPVSAQEVWDNAPVDKLLAHDKTLRAIDRL